MEEKPRARIPCQKDPGNPNKECTLKCPLYMDSLLIFAASIRRVNNAIGPSELEVHLDRLQGGDIISQLDQRAGSTETLKKAEKAQLCIYSANDHPIGFDQ